MSLTTIYNYPSQDACYGSPNAFMICNKPTSVIDPNNNETDYKYDPNSGEVSTETGPPDTNGVTPQTRNTYQQYTAPGQSGAIWLLTSSSTCLSATSTNPASCVGTAAERVTTYAYGNNNRCPYSNNNLWLTSVTTASGDGSNSETTCYGYDYVGNVTSVTDPKGNTSYTTYDALRRKVYEISASPGGGNPRLITHHVYDHDSNEIQTETGTGFNTDGSDFTPLRHVQRTFDPTTGLLTRTQVVVP